MWLQRLLRLFQQKAKEPVKPAKYSTKLLVHDPATGEHTQGLYKDGVPYMVVRVGSISRLMEIC